MSMNPLALQSEPYNEFGNISAEGVQRLLGTPHSNRLQTAIRESVQNSWDARLPETDPHYRIELQVLDETRMRHLRERVFSSVPPVESGLRELQEFLRKDQGLVLVLSDFGTKGLEGPTSPLQYDEDQEAPDFVNFLRNIGSPRDVLHGGGTYGYGKSSLFRLSCCGTILVHSVARHRGRPVNRLMAAAVGQRYGVRSGPHQGKYTGRHWWGRFDSTGRLDPVEDNEAARHAYIAGFPQRGGEERGTSIMILDPQLEVDSREEVAREILETLLWSFWPKMIGSQEGAQPMHFSVAVDGEEMTIPDPSEFPPLNLHVRALRAIHRGGASRVPIWLGKPKKHLGHLAMEREIYRPRRWPANTEGTQFPNQCAHVALMRPAELVVRYVQGDSLPDRAVEWGGVFVCSDEEEVEQAFADAEPPAHDDWDPSSLPKGSHQRSYVKVALDRVRDHMREFARPLVAPEASSASRVPLGAAADLLGSRLLGSGGDRLGAAGSRQRGRRGRGGASRPRGKRVGEPVFQELREVDGQPCALYRVRIAPGSAGSLRLLAHPAVLQEGGDRVDEAPNGKRPQVMNWMDEEGRILSSGPEVEFTESATQEVAILVSIPDYIAITLHLSQA